jgi:hypothetical protein
MVMRKNLVLLALFLGFLQGQAKEKIMNIQKTDGTNSQARVTELKQISFLAVDAGSQGLLVKTSGGETASILFESNPIVTISNGRLIVKSGIADKAEFEITDIAEIQFGEASGETGVNELKNLAYVMLDGEILLRGIPKGVKPRVYSIDGHSLPTPPFRDGELRFSRATLGSGIYLIKVGTFSVKIRF